MFSAVWRSCFGFFPWMSRIAWAACGFCPAICWSICMGFPPFRAIWSMAIMGLFIGGIILFPRLSAGNRLFQPLYLVFQIVDGIFHVHKFIQRRESRGNILRRLFPCLLLAVELKHIRRAGVGVESLHVDYIVSEVGEKHGSTHKVHWDPQRLLSGGHRTAEKVRLCVCIPNRLCGLYGLRRGLLHRLVDLWSGRKRSYWVVSAISGVCIIRKSGHCPAPPSSLLLHPRIFGAHSHPPGPDTTSHSRRHSPVGCRQPPAFLPGSYITRPLYKNNGVREEGGDVYQPLIPTSSMLKLSQKNSPAGCGPSRGFVRFMYVLCTAAQRPLSLALRYISSDLQQWIYASPVRRQYLSVPIFR
nr:MAG TPA: hypothetical protein [Caudoviricetes sp.]